ncbi:hypothetical protein [Butyrivibrio sp. FC2001]|uniref:hypothetical protein n=1 Tax=Butyrivibrio sp. FC2001 TaxID=1280671 RepID=UPI0004045F79|nr:hypothetical protein [Butyrivibrio sp. FC2001]
MNKKVSLIIKTLAFLAILFTCFFGVMLLVERKSSFNKNQAFFEEAKKDHIDAFFLGSSHVINGVNPLQLFEEHGYTSYNLGGYGSVLLSSYWQMMLALDYCTPKLVVVDSYMLENDIRYIDDPAANVDSDELHLNIDRFPLSKTKYHAINDMFQNQDEKYPYFADFIVYHDRWKELGAEDFKRFTKDADINRMMGAVMEYGVHSAEYNYVDYGAGMLEQETVGTTYLRRIIEECQSRGIQVVVVTLPFLAMGENQAAAHTATQIAAEYGVSSLNMLEIPGIIDINTDMEDPGHLNILGCQKVTSYLGNYIAENCPLQDHREDPAYENWNDSLNDFHAELASMREGNDDIYTQLMMLKYDNSDKTYAVSIRGASSVYGDAMLLRQLHALGASEKLDEAAAAKCSYMLISDHGVITDFAGDSEEEFYIETTDGSFSYSPASDIYRVLYINGDTENNFLYADDLAYADVQLLFFSNGVCTSHQYYTSDHFTYDYDQR